MVALRDISLRLRKRETFRDRDVCHGYEDDHAFHDCCFCAASVAGRRCLASGHAVSRQDSIGGYLLGGRCRPWAHERMGRTRRPVRIEFMRSGTRLRGGSKRWRKGCVVLRGAGRALRFSERIGRHERRARGFRRMHLRPCRYCGREMPGCAASRCRGAPNEQTGGNRRLRSGQPVRGLPLKCSRRW